MTVSDNHLQEFIKIYQRIYGLQLSHKEATVLANNLITVMAATYRPIRVEKGGEKHNG